MSMTAQLNVLEIIYNREKKYPETTLTHIVDDVVTNLIKWFSTTRLGH